MSRELFGKNEINGGQAVHRPTEEMMTPEEKIKAVGVMKVKLEEDFISLGELLSEIKRMRTYRIKGYKSFKDFVEIEHNLPASVANKLVKIYDFYIKDMDIDSATVQEIGLDRLNTIHPFVKDSDYVVQEAWIEQAKRLSQQELSEAVKDVRKKTKENSKTLKDVFVEQFMDNMKGYFNCSGKELNYKLALYFQDMSLDVVNDVIRIQQRKFEEQLEETPPVSPSRRGIEEEETTPSVKYTDTPPQRGINGGQAVHRPTEEEGK